MQHNHCWSGPNPHRCISCCICSEPVKHISFMENQKEFNVVVDATKRATVKVLASSEDEAKSIIQSRMGAEGIDFLEFDPDLFDNITIQNAYESKQTKEEGNKLSTTDESVSE